MIDNGARPDDPAKNDGDPSVVAVGAYPVSPAQLRDETAVQRVHQFREMNRRGYSISRCAWSSSRLHSVSTAPKSSRTSANSPGQQGQVL